MHDLRCPHCGLPATIQQADGTFCPEHATDKVALHERMHELDFQPLPDDSAEHARALAEANRIEYRLGALDG